MPISEVLALIEVGSKLLALIGTVRATLSEDDQAKVNAALDAMWVQAQMDYADAAAALQARVREES